VWKISSVIPNSPTKKSDSYPIFILPVLVKAFENVMIDQMADYVTRNNLTSPFQTGFRPSHSTITALVRVSDDIRSNLELNQPTILELFDFSKVFDSVYYGMFIFKLR
jgi:hypothetical protein